MLCSKLVLILQVLLFFKPQEKKSKIKICANKGCCKVSRPAFRNSGGASLEHGGGGGRARHIVITVCLFCFHLHVGGKKGTFLLARVRGKASP